jgi:hypothetical protein
MLYRRAYSRPGDKRFTNPDGTATSRAFKLRAGEAELSVDVKSMTTAAIAVKDPKKFSLFEIGVQTVESYNLQVFHDSVDGNSAHAGIVGLDEDDDIIPGLLARASKQVNF